VHSRINLSAGLILLDVLILTGCSGPLANQQTQPPPPPAAIQLTVSESGSGTVSSSPSGINCGSTCTGTFNAGTPITLTAAPAVGNSFAGWSGACSGSSPTCTIVLNQATTVAAGFQVIPLQLSISESNPNAGVVSSDPIGINCGQTCTASFNPGTTVALNAAANSGFVFKGWAGACSGSSLTCSVVLNQAATVAAAFDVVPPKLTVSESILGAGVVTSNPAGINCGKTCTATFDPGTTVSLTAAANFGFVFNGWSGACSGSGPCTIALNAPASVTANFSPVPEPPHVVLVVEENASFSTVYPNGMPWLSSLGDAYGIATNYWSDEAGSLHAYLWLSSGSGEDSFACDGAGCNQVITSNNIFRQINKAGLSWKVYAEDLPSAGFMGDSSGYYVKHHNAAPWYSDVVNDANQQQNIVPFPQLAADLAANALPNYAIIIPNQQHDDDTGTLAAADQWLKTNISPLLSSPYFTSPGGNGVLFITFDNADGDAEGHVFTAVIGVKVHPGIKVSAAFRHEDTLRTMMDVLGLSNFPGASANASPMNQFFK
jgi:Phosphoesterase family/Divergent InlB B-repeat domain